MKIRTSKGNEHELTYAGKTSSNSNRLIMEMNDGREMSSVAADFEDLDSIEKDDGTVLLEGNLRIYAIQHFLDGAYRVMIDKE